MSNGGGGGGCESVSHRCSQRQAGGHMKEAALFSSGGVNRASASVRIKVNALVSLPLPPSMCSILVRLESRSEV